MSKIEWQQSFNTGIPTVDEQHKKLVNMINRLEESLAARKGIVNDEIGKVLTDLVDYTKYHFTEEERVQQEIQYSAFEKHKAQHKELIAEIVKILLRLKHGGQINVYEMMNFLRDWLVNHILKDDRAIGVEYKRFYEVQRKPKAASASR